MFCKVKVNALHQELLSASKKCVYYATINLIVRMYRTQRCYAINCILQCIIYIDFWMYSSACIMIIIYFSSHWLGLQSYHIVYRVLVWAYIKNNKFVLWLSSVMAQQMFVVKILFTKNITLHYTVYMYTITVYEITW